MQITSEFQQQVKKLNQNLFCCGELKVNASQNRVFLQGDELVLQPKVMQLLLFLCAAGGQTLSKQQLNQLLWPDTQVGADSLANTMARLRKSLAENSKQPVFIETVQRKGYRWLIPVEVDSSLTSKNNRKQYLLIATIVTSLCILGYFAFQAKPEKFPFKELKIETTEKGLAVEVGVEGEMDGLQQDKVKQEVSRITGHDPSQMIITIDEDQAECSDDTSEQAGLKSDAKEDCHILKVKDEKPQ